jgi:hypothetical protein
LQGGISFFENNKIDGLYDLENYNLSPYSSTDSLIGTLIQSIANCIRIPLFGTIKGIKLFFASTDATYWLYHALIGSTHPSPAYRVEQIRNEIARRLENSTTQAA